MSRVSSRVLSPGLRFAGRDRARPSHVVCRSAADKGDSGKPPAEGRSDVQDALADVMRLNIKKLEALDHLESVTNDEKLKLVQKAEEVCTAPALRRISTMLLDKFYLVVSDYVRYASCHEHVALSNSSDSYHSHQQSACRRWRKLMP